MDSHFLAKIFDLYQSWEITHPVLSCHVLFSFYPILLVLMTAEESLIYAYGQTTCLV